eukprot:TRINITY_DN22226_c0_g1_i1.p1 TRINITY_DN22226_c0_g1~~TRINITY_DN22226_c0_g1_i1.p1  ORF type:complete len:165 (-),score=26.72 TRINITY_DN22226_c0_g1_i1:85-579(-)
MTKPTSKIRMPQDMVLSRAVIAAQSKTMPVDKIPGIEENNRPLPRVSTRTVDKWRSLHELPYGALCGENFERWKGTVYYTRPEDKHIRSKCSASMGATFRFLDMEPPKKLDSTLQDLGARQPFDASPGRLGDKYRSFSMPIFNHRRWDFIHEQGREAARPISHK